MAYTGNLDAKHNVDGSTHQQGQGEEHTCFMSWGRVTFEDGVGGIVMGSEAILARCPNGNCQAIDLKVVDVTLVVSTT